MIRPENVRCENCCYWTRTSKGSKILGRCVGGDPTVFKDAEGEWKTLWPCTCDTGQYHAWVARWDGGVDECCHKFCAEWPGLRSPSYAPKLGDGAFTMLPAEMTGHGRCKIHLIWDEDHNAWTMWSSGEIFEEGVSST